MASLNSFRSKCQQMSEHPIRRRIVTLVSAESRVRLHLSISALEFPCRKGLLCPQVRHPGERCPVGQGGHGSSASLPRTSALCTVARLPVSPPCKHSSYCARTSPTKHCRRCLALLQEHIFQTLHLPSHTESYEGQAMSYGLDRHQVVVIDVPMRGAIPAKQSPSFPVSWVLLAFPITSSLFKLLS